MRYSLKNLIDRLYAHLERFPHPEQVFTMTEQEVVACIGPFGNCC